MSGRHPQEMHDRLDAVLRQFDVAGSIIGAEPLGHGHIHKTTSVTVSGGKRYVLQELNASVFRDLDACEENLRRLDDHARMHSNNSITIPEHLRTEHGSVHTTVADGSTWRVTKRVENTFAPTQIVGEPDAFAAGEAFGSFVSFLASLPGPPLNETIPDFHNFAARVAQLYEAIQRDRAGRVAQVHAELLEADRLIGQVGGPANIIALDRRQSVHNDAKITNLLCDVATRQPIVVVDLDTTMPGSPLLDLGELIRSGASERPEDSRDLHLIEVQADVVRALTDGFLSTSGSSAIDQDLHKYAGPILSVENGLRFLADYLNGDTYFRSERNGQNLDRARVQFRLADQLLKL
jgi:Phosphotransferase enzyme family